MNVKRKYLIAILFTCLVAGQIAGTYADYIPHMEVSAENIYLTAGTMNNVTLRLTNVGTFDLTEIDNILTSSTPGLSVTSNSHYVANKIASSEFALYNVTIFADQSLAVGSYTLSYQANYVRFGRSVTVVVPITLVVNKAFQPKVLATVSPSSIMGGATTAVTMTIENISNETIFDLDVTVSPGSPLLSVENQLNYNSPALLAGSSTSFEVAVKALENTPVGAYYLGTAIYYSDAAGNRYRQSVNLPLDVTSVYVPATPIITVTNLSTVAISPGEQFDMNLKIACSGAVMYNGKATLSLDQAGLLTPVSPLNLAVGDLQSGESILAKYTLIMDGKAPTGELPITVTVRYVDSRGIATTATETVTISVKQFVSFKLMEDAVITAESGKTTTFEGDLLLIGVGKVEFASVEVVAEAPIERVAGSSEYIGVIDPDSPIPFTIRFKTQNGTAVGDSELKLQVTFLNNRNVEESRTITVPLKVVEPSLSVATSNDDGGLWGWLRRLFGLQ